MILKDEARPTNRRGPFSRVHVTHPCTWGITADLEYSKSSMVLKHLVGLESCISLESRNQGSDDRVAADAVGSVVDGANTKDSAEDASHSLLDWVLEHGRVLGPVVVEESCASPVKIECANRGESPLPAVNRKPLPWYHPVRAQVLCSWGRVLMVACDCQSRPLICSSIVVSKVRLVRGVGGRWTGRVRCGQSTSAARRRQ